MFLDFLDFAWLSRFILIHKNDVWGPPHAERLCIGADGPGRKNSRGERAWGGSRIVFSDGSGL